MYDEYLLIREIGECQNKEQLNDLREKIVDFFEDCKSVESMRRVQNEFKKAKNRVKKTRIY